MTNTCAVGTLTWTAEGARINAPNDNCNATFSLKIDDDAPIGDFTFTIAITY